MRFQGQTVLVTGASGGLGAAMAQRFAHEGAHVVVGARNRHAGEAVAAQIRRDGGAAEFVELDVRDEQAWARTVDHLRPRGHLQVLVNNAGLGSGASDGGPAGFDLLANTNARGTYLAITHLLPLMRPRGGAVVNIGSVAGARGIAAPVDVGYSASKAAVAALTRSFAVREGQHGIRVNAVVPGLCRPMRGTELTHESSARAGLLERIPLRRAANDEEIASAVAFLASSEASYITGVELVVDGGWLAGL